MWTFFNGFQSYDDVKDDAPALFKSTARHPEFANEAMGGSRVIRAAVVPGTCSSNFLTLATQLPQDIPLIENSRVMI